MAGLDATALKDKGNELYKEHAYLQAAAQYSKALKVEQDPQGQAVLYRCAPEQGTCVVVPALASTAAQSLILLHAHTRGQRNVHDMQSHSDHHLDAPASRAATVPPRWSN
jgi:hypothetical protein